MVARLFRAPAQTFFDRCLALWASDRLLRGFGLLGLGEFVVRATRVLTAIALARMLDPVDLGIAATAITCFELVRILANNGLGQMVIRAAPAELDATCNTAEWLIWQICIAMTVLQVAAGAVIAHMASEPRLFAMIACLAAVYLTMPPGMVQSWLLRREGAKAFLDLRQSMTDLRDPTETMAHGALILFAAVLLITPGFFTDALGLALLIRPVRKLAIRAIGRRFRIVPMGGGRRGPGPDPGGDVIDADYTELDEKPLGGPPSAWTRH